MKDRRFYIVRTFLEYFESNIGFNSNSIQFPDTTKAEPSIKEQNLSLHLELYDFGKGENKDSEIKQIANKFVKADLKLNPQELENKYGFTKEDIAKIQNEIKVLNSSDKTEVSVGKSNDSGDGFSGRPETELNITET
ncbi:MAG: hypothetical protein MK033_07785 [Candidatus Caenarcaniphilales bacterium]|nr:hypothetical protein [Candidatus Caenarcaniphilales bacterium]